MPLLPNGKLDLKALPEPDWSLASAADEYVAPTDAVEEGVASIWAQSLGLEDPIGIYTDFYRLGGTSLKAIALAAALKGAFDLPGSTAPLLNMSTVSEMAAYVRKLAPAGALTLHAGGNVVIQPKGLAGHIWEDAYRPLSAGQVQMYMLQTTDPTSFHYNESLRYTIKGDFSPAVFELALNNVVQRHEVLQTVLEEGPKGPRARVNAHIKVPVAVHDLSEQPVAFATAASARLCKDAFATPFILTSPPLLRAVVVCISKDLYEVIIVVHHAVTDGWSMGNLGKELAAAYNSWKAGNPSPLQPLPMHYSDFAAWQGDWLKSPAAAEQVAYWKRTLHAAPHLLQLPLDHPRPPVPSYKGGSHQFTMPAHVVRLVRSYAASRGSTLFLTVMSAFKVLLSQYGREEDIIVGSSFATRPPGTQGKLRERGRGKVWVQRKS